MKLTATLPAAFAVLTLFSCQKETAVVKEIPNNTNDEMAASFHINLQTFDYQADLPNYLVTMGLIQPAIDNNKAALGRVVFYDTNFSSDGKISCASCHHMSNGFADNQAFSSGVNGERSSRNALALTNVANFAAHYTSIEGKQPMLLWDGRASNVSTQSTLAFTNPHEMNMTMDAVVEKASQLEYYPYLVKKAYGDGEINEQRLLESLEEFVRAMGAADSKLDRALEKVNGDLFGTYNETITTVQFRDTILATYYGTGDDSIRTKIAVYGTSVVTRPLLNFSVAELSGRSLFAQHCTNCHSPIRTAQEVFMACNGLDMNYSDAGLAQVTGQPGDKGVFKSPALRNVALTAPYMHDGRFKTLDEVMDFYSEGIQPHPNLHPLLKDENGQPVRMNFSAQDKADLIAFLKTMTSPTIQFDRRFSDPFLK